MGLSACLYSLLTFTVSTAGIAGEVRTDRHPEKETGRQWSRQHGEWLSPAFYLILHQRKFLRRRFFFCSAFWPNSPTRRKRPQSLQSIWTLKRFSTTNWYLSDRHARNDLSRSSSASLSHCRTMWRQPRSFQESWSQLAATWSLSWAEQRQKRPDWPLRFRSVNTERDHMH